jgi:hypothetical protein
MLERGVGMAAYMALIYAAIYALHRVGWLKSGLPDTERILVTIAAWFLAGCLTNFFAWDRLIEEYRQIVAGSRSANKPRTTAKEKVG